MPQPNLWGAIASLIFVVSTLPMLHRAYQTRLMTAYSGSNLLLSNLGNLIYWLYVISLPVGPVWVLHGYYTLTTLLMFVFWLRWGQR